MPLMQAGFPRFYGGGLYLLIYDNLLFLVRWHHTRNARDPE